MRYYMTGEIQTERSPRDGLSEIGPDRADNSALQRYLAGGLAMPPAMNAGLRERENKVMRVWLVILVSAFAILAAPNAQAQISVDLAKVTCKQYLFDNLISANAPMVAVWLSGYFNGKRNNTVIDIGTFKKNKDVVEDYCRMNQDVTLIDAATKALGLDK
jgi:acid stress chaperone HdeB